MIIPEVRPSAQPNETYLKSVWIIPIEISYNYFSTFHDTEGGPLAYAAKITML